MTPLEGRRIGRYQLASRIGAGGMGEVYKAIDSNLKRSVAIKVLPASLAGDAERLARFQREAEVLAALNHPNIAAIYGLERSGDTTALVMELVEGPTLADRIAQGAIQIDEALPIAKQIAEALEAAHEQGIIHRDLKPANIKVRSDGTVKVLDFGLAKVMAPAPGSSPNLSQSPTITTPAMTQAGMILGTAAYMSPEQAKGRQADRRSDLWAFGAVLYEMLTGKRAFAGEDTVDVLSRVLQREPEWGALPAGVSPTLVLYLKRCLYKDSKQRLADMHDMRLALEGAFDTTAPQTTLSATSSAPRGRLAWIAFAVALVAAIALGVPAMRHLRETPLPETRVDIKTPVTDEPMSFALAPDGRQIVFAASGDGGPRLWLRFLAASSAQPLVGTEGGTFPFWSPDSQSIGFFADGKLKRVGIGGGSPQVLATAVARGGTWNADGIILFTFTTAGPLFRVPASGGQAVAVAVNLDGRASSPSFLPDGRQFLFSTLETPATVGIYLGSLDSPNTQRLTSADSAGAYLSSGWLLWVRAGTLVAQRLDLTRKELTGDPVTVADPVASYGPTPAVSVSTAGLVAYRAGGTRRRQLAWFDRSGNALGVMGVPSEDNLSHPSVAPDGRRVAVDRTERGNADIWVLEGTGTSRVTFDAAADLSPIWSPDGARIVFNSSRKGDSNLYQKSSSGGGAEEPLFESPLQQSATDWSNDGQFILYFSLDPQTNGDLWVLPMEGDRKPSVFLKTGFNEVFGQFSPDRRWVVYRSNESGRNEIYIRAFAATASRVVASPAAGQWQVSSAGGIFPRWRSDGKELYYIGPKGEMMAVPIAATETTLEPGAPVTLFPTRIVGGGADNFQGRQYDVTRDGRFLINTDLDEGSSSITLLQNWTPGSNK